MKKAIAITIALSMILLSFGVVFADDEDSGSSYEAPESEIVLPDTLLPAVLDDDTVRESDLMLRQFSVSLAQALATPTGNETAADIYALLYSAFINNPGGTSSFSVTDSSVIAWLQNIAYFLGYNNNSSQGSPLYYTLLSGSELSISELMYVLVSQMLNLMDLSATDSSNNPIPLVQLFVQLANDVTGLSTNNTSQLNNLVTIAASLNDSYGSSIANRVYDIWAYMRDTIHGYDFYYTISALNSINTTTTHIDQDLHDIKQWLDETFYYDITNYLEVDLDYYLQPNSSYQARQLPMGNSSNNVLQSNPIIPVEYIIDGKVTLYYPNQGSSDIYNGVGQGSYIFRSNDELNFLLSDRVTYTFDWNLYKESGELYCDIDFGTFDFTGFDYISPFMLIRNTNIHFVNNIYVSVKSNQITKGNYVKDINDNIYHIDNDIHGISSILEVFKDIYASDDLIEAKEAQQPLEDSVLENFTGSGSASASVSDANDIKGIQSSVKGSLDTGVNPSGITTILDTSNPTGQTSFFSFWTQGVADDINGVNNVQRTRAVYVHLDENGMFEQLKESSSW